MKRIPGIKPRFSRCTIVRPDGNVLPAWEMFVGERSYGRSNSKAALLRSWEARLEEAENARPFVFRPARKMARPTERQAAAPPRVGEHTSLRSGNVDRPMPERAKASAG